MNRRRLVVPLVVVGLVALVVGLVVVLGGGDDDKGDGGFAAKRSLVPAGKSAAVEGEVENYEPTGELIADSGFRPEVDGFAFENYGNDEDPQNLGPANMEALFGEQVCLSGTGDECELTPAAAEWMENQNAGMDGGHCQGFSVAALRMYNEDLDQEDFGAEATSELDIVENDPLQASIAEHFVYQFLPPVVESRVKGTPSEVLQTLVDALESGEELYTLGVYHPDLTGGHAITPYAVEDKGDGQYAILVYDNNFPGTTRAVEVDTNAETWSYVSGTNPDEVGQVYEGNADTQTLELDPTTPGEQLQPCPFCSGEEATEGEEGTGATRGSAGGGRVLEEDEQYTEITLEGDPSNHPHLVFTDDRGRRTGIVNGRLLREIPDVEVVRALAVQNWEQAAEPRYRLPEGRDYTITVDGSSLERPTDKTTIDLVGNGLVIEIEDIRMKPGQKDEMSLPGGYGITYQSNTDEEVAPNIFAGLVQDGAAYNFTATAVDFKPGSTISLLVEQEEKVVILDATGSEGVSEEEATFIVALTKADADGHISQWLADDVQLDGAAGEGVGFEYAESPTEGEPLPLIVLDEDGDPTGDPLEAAPQEVEQDG